MKRESPLERKEHTLEKEVPLERMNNMADETVPVRLCCVRP
jgi:hypothetical protein